MYSGSKGTGKEQGDCKPIMAEVTPCAVCSTCVLCGVLRCAVLCHVYLQHNTCPVCRFELEPDSPRLTTAAAGAAAGAGGTLTTAAASAALQVGGWG